MMKLGIFGGAFNPIHKGHINLCLQCKELLDLDKILLVPTNISPHKTVLSQVSFEDRFNMTKLAVANLKNFDVSDVEHKRGGTSYTFDTLAELKKELPDAEFYLIIGSDMFEIFDKWHRYSDILSIADIVVGARNDNEYDKLVCIKKEQHNSCDKIHILKICVVEMSSTEIRNDIAVGDGVREKLENAVLDYIKSHHLYS